MVAAGSTDSDTGDAVRGEPRDIVSALADGTMAPADWTAHAAALCLTGVSLRPETALEART